MNVVYLSGLISTEYLESLTWRASVEPVLVEAGFQVLSPMRGKDNLVNLTTNGGLTDPRLTDGDIVLRDYRDILDSDIILAHLETFGSPRPLLGTIAELGWGWSNHTPIVGVAHPGNLLMRTHPFITRFVSHFCQDVEDAVDFVIQHYSRRP